MKRSIRLCVLAVSALLLASAPAAAAPEQPEATPPGEPYSAERRAVCESRQSACLRTARATCTGVPVAQGAYSQCLEDVRTSCTKDFQRCFEGQQPSAGTSPPPSSPAPTGSSPGSCNVLVANMLAYAHENPLNRIHVVWTTNYFANATRFAGVNNLMLRAQGRTLIGEGQRRRTFFGGHHVEVENVSLRIRYDLKVLFQDTYGPYGMTCSANKFAVVYTGDSVETLNFKFPPH